MSCEDHHTEEVADALSKLQRRYRKYTVGSYYLSDSGEGEGIGLAVIYWAGQDEPTLPETFKGFPVTMVDGGRKPDGI